MKEELGVDGLALWKVSLKSHYMVCKGGVK